MHWDIMYEFKIKYPEMFIEEEEEEETPGEVIDNFVQQNSKRNDRSQSIRA